MDGGMNSNFPSGNATNMLQQMSNYNNIQNNPNAPVQQLNMTNNNNIPPEINPKRQVVFDRLTKRVGNYRKRHSESIPRFDQTFSGICEQQSVETNVLQKRFVESKAKRVAKKADKKATDVTNTVTVVSFFLFEMNDVSNDVTIGGNKLFQSSLITSPCLKVSYLEIKKFFFSLFLDTNEANKTSRDG